MTDQQTDSPTEQAEEQFFVTPEGVSDTEQDEDQVEAEPEAEQPQDSPQAEAEQEQAEGEEVAESEEVDSQDEEISPKQDPEAFQHWQSKYQKAESKLGMKPEELSDDHAELIKTMLSNPEYLQGFADYITNGAEAQEGQGDSQPEETQELVEPTPPEEPAGYNPYDLNDPESETYKYEQKRKKYLEDMIRYERKQREKLQESLQEKERKRELTQKEQQIKSQLKRAAMEQRGYSEEQAEDFVNFVDRARNDRFEVNEVFALYEGFSGVKADQERNSRDKEEKVKKKEKLKKKHAPSPGSTGGAGNPGGKGPKEEGFFQERKY